MTEHLEDIDSGAAVDAGKEYYTEIMRIGYACNEKCIFCNVYPKPEDMDPKNFTLKAIQEKIDAMSEKGVESVAFTGGEPTLHPDILKIIAYAAGKLKRVSIQTNALKCDARLVSRMQEEGLAGAFVSFHSHLPEIQEILTRKPGSFARTVRGIKNLVEADVEVNINTVVNSMNQEHLPGFAEFIIENFPGIDSLCISFVQPRGYGYRNPGILPDYEKARPYLKKTIEFLEGASFTVNNPACGVPACFWDGKIEYCNELAINRDFRRSGRKRSIDWFGEVISEKVKDVPCKECTLKNLCCGFFPTYRQLMPHVKMMPPAKSLKYWD